MEGITTASWNARSARADRLQAQAEQMTAKAGLCPGSRTFSRRETYGKSILRSEGARYRYLYRRSGSNHHSVRFWRRGHQNRSSRNGRPLSGPLQNSAQSGVLEELHVATDQSQ